MFDSIFETSLQPTSMMQIHPQSNNTEEQSAASSGKATQLVCSKHLLPKIASCVPNRELQFSNNPNTTHNFSSTLTTKSAVPVDTCLISMRVQSRPPPALMSQSMMKWSAQHTKPPQILLDAMFAQLVSNWKCCEGQQKEIVSYSFPWHWPQKQFQQFVVNQSLFWTRCWNVQRKSRLFSSCCVHCWNGP